MTDECKHCPLSYNPKILYSTEQGAGPSLVKCGLLSISTYKKSQAFFFVYYKTLTPLKNENEKGSATRNSKWHDASYPSHHFNKIIQLQTMTAHVRWPCQKQRSPASCGILAAFFLCFFLLGKQKKRK
jgi:hypothetical protein